MNPIEDAVEESSENHSVIPMYDRPINIMMDLETLGTDPGCTVLSIGATVFLEEKRNQFYMKISRTSSAAFGFYEDPKTLEWWSTQDTAVFEEACSGEDSVAKVLVCFTRWLESITATPIIWGNAASFDCGVLAAAYSNLGMEKPWSFKNEMCYRTLKNLYTGCVPVVIPVGVAHNALDDAINQANQVEVILAYDATIMQHAAEDCISYNLPHGCYWGSSLGMSQKEAIAAQEQYDEEQAANAALAGAPAITEGEANPQ